MARTTTLSDPELAEMTGHIAYDLWMLLEAAQLCGLSQMLRLGRPWECAAVESFGVHLRNLLGFLYPDPDPKALRDGDVIAGDYIATPIGDQSDLVIAEKTVKEWKQLVSTRLAHVSTARAAGITWPVAQLATEVSQQFRGFLRDVAKPDLAERFRAELDALGLSFEQ